MTDESLPSEQEAALTWAVRSGDPRFADWDALTEWLEGDPARADAYHRAAAAMADAADALRRGSGPAVSVPAPEPARRSFASRRVLVAGALAAGVAGLIGWSVMPTPDRSYTVQTAAGERRSVPLPDGSRVSLAGATRVRLDESEPRLAVLERGQALFDVRHDAARPFRVLAAGRDVTDLGTVFEVALDGDRALSVAVAEGAVRLGGGAGAPMDLTAGERARVAGDRVVRGRVDARAVGAWTSGQLSYADAAVAEVAAGAAGALGIAIRVDPAVAGRRFTGTLSLDALRRDPAVLGALTGGRMVRDGEGRGRGGWELRPAS